MDPEATLVEIERILTQEGSLPDIVQHFDAYLQWRAGGGFEPVNGDTRCVNAMTRTIDSIVARRTQLRRIAAGVNGGNRK